MKEKPFKGIDITGKRYGRLVIIGLDGFKKTKKSRKAIWRAQCDCGEIVTTHVGLLGSGHTRSCGCLHREELAARSRIHGYKPLNGEIHPLYYLWQGMHQRCRNPNNKAFRGGMVPRVSRFAKGGTILRHSLKTWRDHGSLD